MALEFVEHPLREGHMGMELDNAPVANLDAQSLGAGQLGLILAPAGIGKTAVLVHVALEALLADRSLLHVSLSETVEHVRSHYHEVIGGLARTGQVRDRSDALVASERHRVIHSYLDKGFDLGHLERNLDMLAEVAQFEPRVVVIDGFAQAELAEQLPALRTFAIARGVPVWLTARSDDTTSADLPVDVALVLRQDGEIVAIDRTTQSGTEVLAVRLDPSSHLLLGASDDTDSPKRSRRAPGECTMYSGGATGAEEAFGVASEKWGVQEVNFTFDGHKQSRDNGRYALSPRELAAGDVSLVYVSRRLNRTYSEGTLIRKVLQTLWHMVSRSQQVFVIGSIQEDGTVVGGTGWSVELARMWNKDLWVFDQEQSAWFQWSGDAWVPGTPIIDSHHFTGAGTRYLTDTGRKAVEELFERSFGTGAA